MICSQCGSENQAEAGFCQKCGHSLSVTVAQPAAIVHQTPGAQNAIWNPNAAAAWSMIFTPAFGSYLQMLNWRTLGQSDKAASAQKWFYVSLVMLAVYVLTGVIGVYMGHRNAMNTAARGLGILFLLIWYFSSGRSQGKYVEEKLGSSYPRKPWGRALLVAIAAIPVYVVAAIIFAFVLHALGAAIGLHPVPRTPP